jgi:LytS/YehU family sensor histidine kinase
VGFCVYAFIHINFKDTIFTFELIDKIMVVYTVLITVGIWEVLDLAIVRFRIQQLPLSKPVNLLKAVFYLTLVSMPLVIAASAISEYYVKPLIECDFSNMEFYRSALSGQVLGWLIIASMIFKIKINQEKEMERDLALVQKELLQSKYQNLKNQVNPHFLFNSFSVLQNLIETDKKKAAEFLEKLSMMYRYLLEKRNEAMSSMQRELEVLKVYLYLLKTRHEDRLIVNIDIDQMYYQTFLPTLSLQMLVENAVKHNRFSKEEPLIIDLFIEDDYLVVKNQLRKKGAPPQSTKVGLENIRNQYSFQTDKSVIIAADEQFFTVKLPVLQGLKLI